MVVPLRRYCVFFEFLRWRRRHLGFMKSRNFIGYWGGEGQMHRRANFVKIGQSVVKILRFFVFFKLAATAILYFQICEILLADGVWRAQTHNFTKFRQNRSIACEDMKIFDFSRWRPPPSWIFKFVKFIG